MLEFLQVSMDVSGFGDRAKSTDAQIGTQKLAEVREIVAACPRLSLNLREAVLAMSHG